MKSRCKVSVALFLFAGFLAAGSEAFASTFLKLDVPGLTGRAESVVHARVVSSESALNARGSMVFTNVTLDVIQPKNGSWSSSNRPNLVTRRELDPSVIGDRRVKIATAPQLQYQHIRYFLSVCYNKY